MAIQPCHVRFKGQLVSADKAQRELEERFAVAVEDATLRQRLRAMTAATAAANKAARRQADTEATDSEDEPLVLLRQGRKEAQVAVQAPPLAAAATTHATSTEAVHDTTATRPALEPIRRNLTDLFLDHAQRVDEELQHEEEPVSRRTRSQRRAVVAAHLSLSQPTEASSAWMADSQEY